MAKNGSEILETVGLGEVIEDYLLKLKGRSSLPTQRSLPEVMNDAAELGNLLFQDKNVLCIIETSPVLSEVSVEDAVVMELVVTILIDAVSVADSGSVISMSLDYDMTKGDDILQFEVKVNDGQRFSSSLSCPESFVSKVVSSLVSRDSILIQ